MAALSSDDGKEKVASFVAIEGMPTIPDSFVLNAMSLAVRSCVVVIDESLFNAGISEWMLARMRSLGVRLSDHQLSVSSSTRASISSLNAGLMMYGLSQSSCRAAT